ncbi:macrophage mannose receptor 1-like [Haliotis rufescens]|uniref:macrophage mannose receptor 1-like n=1 Tax=Haliotis rufescens TaxID=6454 RepID=UPI00201E7E50|nr:macrophage mannose receptor 1-like [Haliotis rufescens]
MAGFIYKSDANLCFKVFTGTALNFNYAEYMCNYYTGGAGGLASLSTTKKFHTVQKYLEDERRDGTYFWVGSEQWQDTDYNYRYSYTFYYYYFRYYFHFYDYNYWADDHKVDYHLWAQGEPNGDSQKCNAIARNKHLQLMDSSCSNKFDFICDIPVLEPDRPWICDSDYIYHRDSNICFKLVHVETEPRRAEDKCRNDGYGTGRLAVLNTMDKFNDVTNHLKDIGEWYPYIVGASQISMWYEINRWHDGTPIDAAVWAPEEPNNIYEECADLRRNFGYKLNDISCYDDAYYYICDIPI